ncbi:OmpA family protein [Polyangium aurulentum]|nr:OmpA family protein [Polyangium aurulentum]
MISPSAARAQQGPTGGTALSRFEPSPAGDAFFSVPSASASGHLVPRAVALFDYADRPLRLIRPEGEVALVSAQGFLRVDASLALLDRVLVSVDFPVAVLQRGDEPDIPGVTLAPPSGPALGDLRLGLRGRLFGEDRSPFQAALGGYLSVPTAPADSYTGEGAVRGHLHAAFGGTIASRIVYSASGGIVLRASEQPHAIAFGAGAAVLLWDERIQIGPELHGTFALSDVRIQAGPETAVTSASRTNAEVLLGAKIRPFKGLVFGVAGGPGLQDAIGTPTFRLLGMVGWAPPASPAKPSKSAGGDRDDDGFRDDIDACPDVKGELAGDPNKDGCPPDDRDGDRVVDLDDACPTEPGPPSPDGTKNGCPLDADDDGVADALDACPKVRGEKSPQSRKNGCPPDRDDDGVADVVDACPDKPGIQTSDPKQRGCPDDPDGDGVKWPNDACPNERGVADARPERNGCPRFVEQKGDELVVPFEIRFHPYGKRKSEAVEPVTDKMLAEIRDEIARHPEIELIEIQGHTDDSGHPRFNQHLSEERAQAVRKWLIDAGVPAEKLTTRGFGHEAPVGDNRIFDGRELNRRVVFKILKRR